MAHRARTMECVEVLLVSLEYNQYDTGRHMTIHHARLACGSILCCCLLACAGPQEGAERADASVTSSAATQNGPIAIDWSQHSGALIRVSMRSTVGVLLDDYHVNQKQQQYNLVRRFLNEKPSSFWIDRAKKQIRLTSLRLNFRNLPGKKQLPLPPEDIWNITFLTESPRFESINGHHLLVMDYDFNGTILTAANSPGIAEPALGTIGGTWRENFVLPLDPEFLLQRTGYACFNESQFPPNSVDAEEADLFYDDRCAPERTLSVTGCHQTQMPSQSCTAALREHVGEIKTSMIFERRAWDHTIADAVRTGGVTNSNGPDLQPYQAGFKQHRFTYRYIPHDSCTLEEKCVGGPGWRQVLMFPTGDINVGSKELEIGFVDYFHTQNGSVLSDHGVFEYSACHKHYHFAHYGSFTLGTGKEAVTHKNGFCLQPSSRIFNNEISPLHHPYVDCIHQGVSVGWIDEYRMGLECQWVDVTDLAPGRNLPLTFVSNPSGLLCEGTLKKDEQGNTLFTPTDFKTASGDPVDAPQCDFFPAWFANNTASYDVSLPGIGESYVTDACPEGVFGEKRNCGYRNEKTIRECTPGKKVTLTCHIAGNQSPTVVRVCEGSRALHTGLPCTYNDALASTVVATYPNPNFSFTCPASRDAIETGGAYSLLMGPLLPGETPATVTCSVVGES